MPTSQSPAPRAPPPEQLSRKIAEERRILQQAAPEDALTVATRRKSHAILRRKSQAQLQQYLHSRGSSFQTSGGEAMAGNGKNSKQCMRVSKIKWSGLRWKGLLQSRPLDRIGEKPPF